MIIDPNGPIRWPDIAASLDIPAIAAGALALVQDRVFNKGKLATGEPASPYSRRGPIYIPTRGIGSGSPLHKPKGGKRSRAGKSQRFDSYADFRARSGLSPNKTFTISGTLARRFVILRMTDHSFVLGWPGGSVQSLIATGHHEREARDLFRLSADEIEAIVRIAGGKVRIV